MTTVRRFALMFFLVVAAPFASRAQSQDVKVASDTIAVQSEGIFLADPDLATLEFSISSQDKDLKRAYANAAQSAQRIVELAQRNGLSKDDVTTGVLTVYPQYDNSRNRHTRAHTVDGRVILKLRDFTKICAVIDESIQDGITDFRSLTYSLADEEAAKRNAVAEAMRRAAGRAGIALEQRNQKLGPLRYANLDVRQVAGISRIEMSAMEYQVNESNSGGLFGHDKKALAPPPPPVAQAEKINVTATVQCVYQIQ